MRAHEVHTRIHSFDEQTQFNNARDTTGVKQCYDSQVNFQSISIYDDIICGLVGTCGLLDLVGWHKLIKAHTTLNTECRRDYSHHTDLAKAINVPYGNLWMLECNTLYISVSDKRWIYTFYGWHGASLYIHIGSQRKTLPNQAEQRETMWRNLRKMLWKNPDGNYIEIYHHVFIVKAHSKWHNDKGGSYSTS